MAEEQRRTVRVGVPQPGARGALQCKAHAQVSDDATIYEDDEFEFLKAIDTYKREKRRPYPTWVEVLNVLKALGWRKC